MMTRMITVTGPGLGPGRPGPPRGPPPRRLGGRGPSPSRSPMVDRGLRRRVRLPHARPVALRPARSGPAPVGLTVTVSGTVPVPLRRGAAWLGGAATVTPGPNGRLAPDPMPGHVTTTGVKLTTSGQ
jgi:hypothetical protein